VRPGNGAIGFDIGADVEFGHNRNDRLRSCQSFRISEMIEVPENMTVLDRHRKRVRHWRVLHFIKAFGDSEKSGGPIIYRLSESMNHKTDKLRQLIECVEMSSDAVFIYDDPVALLQTTRAVLLRWIEEPSNWDGAFLCIFDDSLRWAIFTDDDSVAMNSARLYMRE
jgi:hypothetical protein